MDLVRDGRKCERLGTRFGLRGHEAANARRGWTYGVGGMVKGCVRYVQSPFVLHLFNRCC